MSIASWVAIIILFLINGLSRLGSLTIQPHTLGWCYIIAMVVIVVDLFYANRSRLR